MKRIVEEIKRIEKVTSFVAFEGTKFATEEECRKFEQKALYNILGEMGKFTLNECSEDNMYYGGNPERKVYVLAPKTANEIDTINNFLKIVCVAREVSQFELVCDSAIGDTVFVTLNADGTFAWAETKTQIVSRIENCCRV